jgi:hypothetical protein
VLDFDAKSVSGPIEIAWCGEDAVVLQWRNTGVYMYMYMFMCMYMYMYMYMCYMCMCVCVCVYVYGAGGTQQSYSGATQVCFILNDTWHA